MTNNADPNEVAHNKQKEFILLRASMLFHYY